MNAPYRERLRSRVLAGGFAVALVAIAGACGPAEHGHSWKGADPLHDNPAKLPPEELGLPGPSAHEDRGETFAVPPPPLSKVYWPCTDCHDDTMPANKVRRELKEEHTKIVLEHDAEHRWCLDCHDPDNRDVLRLASGANVPFEESYKLCGQCHGPTFRDWKLGIHGKRTGMWNGEKKYLLCAHCHDPHSPHFKPLTPKPPPDRPEAVR